MRYASTSLSLTVFKDSELTYDKGSSATGYRTLHFDEDGYLDHVVIRNHPYRRLG